MGRLAFVIRRYVEGVSGGAETLARETAACLAEIGHPVEILTTCIHDYRDCCDAYPPGETVIKGVTVRRFPTLGSRDSHQHEMLSMRIAHYLMRGEEEEYEWLHHGLHSPALYSHLREHGRDYCAVIAIDYSVSLSIYAQAANSGTTIAWPLLHAEPTAELPLVRRWLNTADGIIFNVLPESDYARCILGVANPRTALVGVGINTALVGDPDRFRDKYCLDDPFLLYVGRTDLAKNVPKMIDYFERHRTLSNSRLKMVLIGDGPPIKLTPGVIHLGYCSEQDKFDAYAAAMALVQPSLLESLSIVVLEALAQGTPILVHGANDVTRYHCLTGNCGLYYYGKDDFVAAVDFLYDHPRIRKELGRNGREYVLQNYHWDKVSARLIAALERFTA